MVLAGDGMFQEISSTLWIICCSCGVGGSRDKAGDGTLRQTPQWGEMGDDWVFQMEGGRSEGMPATILVMEEIK
jgi:hypothetical protein